MTNKTYCSICDKNTITCIYKNSDSKCAVCKSPKAIINNDITGFSIVIAILIAIFVIICIVNIIMYIATFLT